MTRAPRGLVVPDQRTVTAWHEAGHGLVCALEFGNVVKVTIKPEGRALGQQFVERFAHNRPTPATLRLLPS